MITVDTTRAEAAGITARSEGGRSYFAKVADAVGPARLRMWTDYPYAAALKEFKTRASKVLRRRDITIEIGPPGRRSEES